MIIAVDFDGTIVEHEFPDIGSAVPGCFEWLKRFQEAGAKLILWTMRSDGRETKKGQPAGDFLTDAIMFCREQGIEFWATNSNPQQSAWTDSPKAYAHLYIDDAAFGCPLKENPDGRPFVDWEKVGPIVLQMILEDK